MRTLSSAHTHTTHATHEHTLASASIYTRELKSKHGHLAFMQFSEFSV